MLLKVGLIKISMCKDDSINSQHIFTLLTLTFWKILFLKISMLANLTLKFNFIFQNNQINLDHAR